MVGHVHLDAALDVGQRHDSADIVLGHIKMDGDYGFANLVNSSGIGNLRRIFNPDDFAIGLEHLVHHAGRRRDQILVELALKTLLHDLHVEQAEEAAAKAKAERLTHLRFVMQRRII